MKQIHSIHRLALSSLVLLSLALPLSATAQSGGNAQGSQDPKGQQGQNGERRGPPPEAFKACEGKSAKASCSFTSPRGEMTGTCNAERGPEIVCAPADKGQGNKNGNCQGQSQPSK